MDYQKMTEPCGLDCFNCIGYLANEDADLIPVLKGKGCRSAMNVMNFHATTFTLTLIKQQKCRIIQRYSIYASSKN